MRHLIFHLSPLNSPGGQAVWKWHLRQLNHFAPLFDGQLVFAINTGGEFTPVEQIAPLLPARSQILAVPNHPELREVYTFPLLLAKTFTLSPDDQIFYAHGKGVSWAGREHETGIRWWSLAMYRWLLGSEGLDASRKAALVGWLKYEGRVPYADFPAWSLWHYVGTFFWFRAADVYRRPWWAIQPMRYGAEAYLSGLFESQHAMSKYRITPDQHFGPGGTAHIYLRPFWEKIGIPTGPDAESYEGSPV